MNIRKQWVVVTIVFVALGAGMIAQSQSRGQSSAPAQVGRFQMVGVPGHTYVLDTVTGQVWEDFAVPSQGRTDDDFKAVKVKTAR